MITAKRINKSGKTIMMLTLVVGLFMLVLNHMTPMIVDDYTYCYSFADGTKIKSLLQIIPSMRTHFYTMNGKLIVHGLFQVLLMFPQWVFDILNTIMACLLCYVIYIYIWRMRHDGHNALLYFYIISSLWFFVHSFGHVFLWAAGSLNYLWATVALLLYMKPVYTDFSKVYTKGFWIIYILGGFIVGTLVESSSFAVIGFYFLWVVVKVLLRREKIELYKLLPMASLVCGYLVILLSPASQGKIQVRRSIVEGIFLSSNMFFTSYCVLLIIGIFLGIVLLLFGMETKKLLEAVIWIFLSYGMQCMLSIAAYHPGRSEAGIGIFLIIADGILLSLLYDHAIIIPQDPWSRKAAWLCRIVTAYICLFLLYQMTFVVPKGFRAIYDTWVQISQRENYIRQEVEKGEEDITVATVRSSSSYSAIYQLNYVDTSRYDTWPNESMAKYFGTRRIYGRNHE